jgi:hypothetical protein
MDNETLKTILDLQKDNIWYKVYIEQMRTMIDLRIPITMEYSHDESVNKIYQLIYDQVKKEGIKK